MQSKLSHRISWQDSVVPYKKIRKQLFDLTEKGQFPTHLLRNDLMDFPCTANGNGVELTYLNKTIFPSVLVSC
jgi:hypothetical protein